MFRRFYHGKKALYAVIAIALFLFIMNNSHYDVLTPSRKPVAKSKLSTVAAAWGPPSSLNTHSEHGRKGSNNLSCVIPSLEPIREVIAKTAHKMYKCLDYKSNLETWIKMRDNQVIFQSPRANCTARSVERKGEFKTVLSPGFILENGMELDNLCYVATCTQDSHTKMFPLFSVPKLPTKTKEKLLAKSKQNKDLPNILILGLDSMSSMHFDVMVPQTMEVMKELGGVTMKGANIVGDGTTANLLAMLVGLFEWELPESRRSFKRADFIDGWPWIWRHLEEKGFATMFGEGCSTTLGAFQYRLKGFRNKPVHYYMRPCESMLDTHIHPHIDDCVGSEFMLDQRLQHLQSFWRAYPEPHKKFAFLWDARYTHSNTPSINSMDASIARNLREMRDSGALDNTLLVIMSDHGPRYGAFRQTKEGKFVERLPLLSIRLPPSYHPEYREILEQNSNTLVTLFDLQATFMEIINKKPPKRGWSLFKRIPDRSCEQQDIEAHWCSCQRHEPLMFNHSLTTGCIDAFVNMSRTLLRASNITEMCHPLSLGAISYAAKTSQRKEMALFDKTNDGHGRKPHFVEDKAGKLTRANVFVAFSTEPNQGLWEVTCELDENQKPVAKETSVSRTDQYGSQPDCIAKAFPHLRQYCLCV